MRIEADRRQGLNLLLNLIAGPLAGRAGLDSIAFDALIHARRENPLSSALFLVAHRLLDSDRRLKTGSGPDASAKYLEGLGIKPGQTSDEVQRLYDRLRREALEQQARWSDSRCTFSHHFAPRSTSR